MKKSFILLLNIFILGYSNLGWAAERGTKLEAEAMVKKAVAYIKTNGKEKGLAEINKPKGQFVDRDLYVFVIDTGGKSLANPSNPKMVGKDMSQLKDADGKYINKERIEIALKHGKGWDDYKWVNPVSKKIALKSAYFKRLGELIVACGIYKE